MEDSSPTVPPVKPSKKKGGRYPKNPWKNPNLPTNQAPKNYKYGIELYTFTADGKPKPTVVLKGGRDLFWVFWSEGIEGYHQRASERESKNGRQKAIYLNHGYFLIKPQFRIVHNIQTTDPAPKVRKLQGKRFNYGIYEVMDAKTGLESVMFCYSLPNKFSTWEPFKDQIDIAMLRLKEQGLPVREDGYLPAVFKFGKSAVGMNGTKYAVVVGVIDPGFAFTKDRFAQVNHHEALEIYETVSPPTNEYESKDGVRFKNEDEQ